MLKKTLLVVALLAIATCAYSSGWLSVEGQLIVSSFQGDASALEETLRNNIVDSSVLGRTLLLTIKNNSQNNERRVHRIAQLLIAKGAELDYSESDGRTALMEACTKRYETVVDELLRAGADINARDAKGRDVWDYIESARGDVSMLLWTLNRFDRERREQAEAVAIKNLRAHQRDGIIIVKYDLDAPGPVPIMLMGSDDDGLTYAVNIKSVDGHVGQGVQPGNDREIIWMMTEDYSVAEIPKAITLDVVFITD